jgi:hypothetical protein
VDDLKFELETLRQKLELVLATDPGVIEQYEQRKDEVCSTGSSFPCLSLTLGQIKSLSRKIEERERVAAKLEK